MLHRIVPDLIVQNYRAGKYQGSFQAVGMFLDLSGFSTLTDALAKRGQHGAEVLVGLMRNVFDPLVKSIFEHGGKIVGFAGDGILALYPIETDERSAALRALASAWWIQQSLASRSRQQTSFSSFAFSAKVGLSLGDVSWGILNSRDLKKATYYYRGTAVDDSANAEHLAQPGDVILSQPIFDVLRADIRADALGSFHRLAGVRSDLPGATPINLPPADEAVSRLFVPEDILERDERGEFRQAVNLFMRFPELPEENLQEFMHILFDLQERYGGLLSRLDFGDKGCNMLMLWGAPVAYENDIGRALNFVLDLKSRVTFPITAGVTYYIAHAGFLGGAMCEYYTCYGWGVNLASRFMMSAPDGSIWVDERIARRIKNRFDAELQGAQRFKGFETEQKVFVLGGRKRQVEAPHQGEFVGREQELLQLANFIQPLLRGSFAGLFVIWGEAGIGKSRLIYEIKDLSELGKWKALWAICQSDQILRYSFNPFRYFLLRYFDLASEMEDAEQKQIFDAKLDELIAHIPDPSLVKELNQTRSALGSLLDLSWSDSLYERLDAEGRYNNTLLALIALFKAESLRRPVVLFIEDAQFLDEDSKAFLPRLKRALTAGPVSYPVAILVSSRRAGSEALLDASISDESLELGALSTQALSSLAEIYLGEVPSPELVRLLEERSEGNPYFAEQILVYLQEENLLEMSEKGWRVTRTAQELSLPADIRALLMARLDQLTSDVRDVIQTASVLGREFDIPVLAAMLQNDSILSDELADAERAEILLHVNQNRYTFTHGLLCDAAYSMQMLVRRVELHAQAVDSLERLYAGDVERHYGELAYHAERANLTTKAAHYLPLAGRQAMESYQNAQALDYFTRALALLPEQDLRTRFDLLLERVEVYKRTGNRKLQLDDIEILEEIADQLADIPSIAKVLVQRSHYCYTTGDYPRVIEISERVVQLIDTQCLSENLDAYVLWFFSLLRLGKLDLAMQKATEALAIARKDGFRKNQAHILNGMGLIAIEENDLRLATEYLTQAIEIAHDVSDVALETSGLNNLGNVAALLGDYSMALDCYERVCVNTRSRGSRSDEGLVLSNLGWVTGKQGDFAASRSYQQQALSIAREVGNLYQEAYTLINLSAVLGVQGEAVAALECARLGYDLCRKIGERSGEAWAMLNMGHAYLLAEDVEQAQTAYEQCLAIREELHQLSLAAEAIAGLIQIALIRDDLPSLSRCVDTILSSMEKDNEFSGAEEPLRIYYSCYQALEKMKDPRSRTVLQNAIRLLEAQVLRFKDERAQRMYVENVPWRRALQEARRISGD
jgi:predicted ATPase